MQFCKVKLVLNRVLESKSAQPLVSPHLLILHPPHLQRTHTPLLPKRPESSVKKSGNEAQSVASHQSPNFGVNFLVGFESLSIHSLIYLFKVSLCSAWHGALSLSLPLSAGIAAGMCHYTRLEAGD